MNDKGKLSKNGAGKITSKLNETINQNASLIFHRKEGKHKTMDHQNINEKDTNLKLLVKNYTFLEQEIQRRTKRISEHICRECATKCCKEELCRESIESKFLSLVIKNQDVGYDRKKGWLGPSGCRLDCGRPLVCYEFFCEKILNDSNFQASNIQLIIKEFISIGNRAYGNAHLICIDNIEKISGNKIVKINSKLEGLIGKLTEV